MICCLNLAGAYFSQTGYLPYPRTIFSLFIFNGLVPVAKTFLIVHLAFKIFNGMFKTQLLDV